MRSSFLRTTFCLWTLAALAVSELAHLLRRSCRKRAAPTAGSLRDRPILWPSRTATPHPRASWTHSENFMWVGFEGRVGCV